MADSLSTIGSIATMLVSSFNNISAGISGTMVQIVDMARQHVSNYTGQTIGSNSIADQYQYAIVNFATADLINLITSQTGGNSVSLGELSINDGQVMNSEQYRQLAEMSLRSLGLNINFAQSLS